MLHTSTPNPMKIKEMPSDDRPREKMIKQGPSSLTNAELIAILIHSGTPKNTALDLSRLLLNQAENNLRQLGKLNIEEVAKLQKGIGMAKATSIVAAFELGKRYQSTLSIVRNQIKSSREGYEYLSQFMPTKTQEEFHALYLDQSNKILSHQKISCGGISETSADVRLILKEAIILSASGIIISHNHPSGNTQPSNADDQVTNKIKEASLLHDIRLLDHIIIANERYYSYADEGRL